MLREDPPTLTQGRTLVVGGLGATLCCNSEVEGELSVQQWRALLRDLSSCPELFTPERGVNLALCLTG